MRATEAAHGEAMERDGRPTAIRQAEPGDARALAGLHLTCSRAQPGGFMHRLGERFFAAYYRTLLAEPTTVILVADAGADGLVGFISGTLDARRQLEALRLRTPALVLAVLPAVLRSPRLGWELLLRLRSVWPGARGDEYVVTSGPRIAYWGWLPDHPAHGGATALVKELLRRLESLGASRVSLEADRLNRKVEVMHRFLGARVVKVMTMRDGRERAVLEYVLGPAAGPPAS